ncbi:MAG: AI-2E family transporter [Rhodospirillales bacterium]|nr:AI-2E family transporter [Rhodospirillales bacterium]
MDMPTRTAPGASYTQRVLIAAAVAAGLFLAWQVADVFILLFGGILLAALLRAVSDPLARMTSLPERWALVLAVVGVVGLFGGTFYVIDERLTEQLAQLATQLPDAWARARDAIQQTATGQRLIEMLQQSGGNPVMPSVSRLGSFASGTLGALANTALVLFLGLFLAANPGLYKRGMLRLLPMRARGRTGDALDAAGDALRRWLVGQLLAMTCVGLLTGVGLWMLGVPLALSLGVLAGLLDFVPYIGPVVAAVPAVLVAFMQSPITALYVALLYALVQQVEGNVIVPLAQRWAVSLPPALSILSVIIFGVLFGFPGLLFATPLIVVMMVLVRKLYVEDTLERTG